MLVHLLKTGRNEQKPLETAGEALFFRSIVGHRKDPLDCRPIFSGALSATLMSNRLPSPQTQTQQAKAYGRNNH